MLATYFTEVEGSGSHRPRVLSAFIRKMSEDKLLVPERCITLSSTVGQGKDYDP